MESNTFDILVEHADQDTLVIFDIDNTLARPENSLGSDEWFCHTVNEKINQGYDYLNAVYSTLPVAYYLHFNLPLVVTDPLIPTIINNLIAQKINVIALTSRGLYLAERTHEQLQSIGISFWMDHSHTEFLLSLTHPCLYKHNIIFTSNNDKGETLLAFLAMLNYHPKKIIFIDDKMHHVESLENALKNINVDIEYVGIRYSGCDHHIHSFDPLQAEMALLSLKESNKAV